MEKFSPIQNKEIDNENINGSNASTGLPQLRSLLEKGLRRVIIFVVYGPGVLGFLWLIGRILRR